MERQLAAIMFTDIVGYTALMGEDEERAFQLLHLNRRIQRPLIEDHGGRWLKEIGDGILATFNNVSQAVLCALEIQHCCCQEKGLKLRIGIHEGEVVFEEDDVFGDGVNIASRLQSLAPEGRIWVSESVHKNLLNKKDVGTAYVSKKNLKNVKESVRIFEVRDSRSGGVSIQVTLNYQIRRIVRAFWAFLPSLAMMLMAFYYLENGGQERVVASHLDPEHPTIAVQPFVSETDHREGQLLAEGIRDDLLLQMSKVGGLTIDKSSATGSFNSGSDLNDTDMVLNGAIRLQGEQLRVSVQLTRINSEIPIWTETYSGPRTPTFIIRIQRNIVFEIAEALNAHVRLEDLDRLEKVPLDNLHLYERQIAGPLVLED